MTVDYGAGHDFGDSGIIYEGQPTGSSAVLVTATAQDSFVSRAVAVNASTASVTVSLWHGIAGAANTTGNELANAVTCPANADTVVFDAGDDAPLTMQHGDVIRGLCSVSGAVVLRIFGKA